MSREPATDVVDRASGPVVELRCPQCGVKLRIPQTDVQKQIRCPACRASFRLGESAEQSRAAAPSSNTPPPIAMLSAAPATPRAPLPESEPVPRLPSNAPAPLEHGSWYVKTTEGELYGPIEHEALREWVDEGRLDHQCQVLCADWKRWQWADQLFPELAAGAPHRVIVADPPVIVADPPVVDRPLRPLVDRPRRPDPEIEFDQYGVPHVKPDDPFTVAEDPFNIGAAGKDEVEETPNEEGLTRTMRRSIAKTRPGVMLLAVIVGLTSAGAIWYGVVVMQYGVRLRMAALGFMGFSLIVGGGLSMWAAYRLWLFGREIMRFTKDETNRRLQAVLVAQRRFWLLAGIVAGTCSLLAILTALLIRALDVPMSMY